MTDKITVTENDFEIEFVTDEAFDEMYQKYCINLQDNDNKTAEQLKQQILDDQQKAEILTKMYQASHNVTHYCVPYIGAEGRIKGTITTITVLNKQHYEQLLEKEKKWDKHTQIYSKDLFLEKEKLEQENKELNKRIETISDDLGNKLQVKEVETELLKQKLERIKLRWNLINVDIDAPEDCVKMCISLKEIIGDKS